jgi:replicative DNA helicase
MVVRKTKEAPLANVPSEQLFLGALLLSEHTYFQHEQTVTSDAFTVPLHRDIYRVIGDVLSASSKLSLSVLGAKLPEEAEGPDGSVTVAAYLATLRHTAHVEHVSATDVADDLTELAGRRQAIAVGERLIRAARAGEASAVDIASDAEAALLDVMHISSPRRPKLISDYATTLLHTAKRSQDGDLAPALSWGLPTLDELMGLMLGGDLGFIIASQGDGKTALALQVAGHVAESGPVLFGSFEMTGDGLAAREIAAASRIPVREIEEGSFDSFQWEHVKEAEKRLKVPQLFILDDRKLSVRQLRAHALGMKRTIGLRALVVDQLDKIKSDKYVRDRFERTADVTSDLKDLAKEMRIPVIVLAQRTRFSQRRDGDTPQIDDADAPSIERDADWVLAVWRKYNWLMNHRPAPQAGAEEQEKWEAKLRLVKNSADVILLKHRRRQSFEQRTLAWEGQFTRFSELRTWLNRSRSDGER